MARRRKGPWRRKAGGAWHTTIGKKVVQVADASATYEEAFAKMASLLTDQGDLPPDQITVGNLFNKFLDWTKSNRAAGTYDFYKRYLDSFAVRHGKKRVVALLPRHVEEWVEAKFSHLSSTSKNDLMKAVARAINWGIQKRYLKHSPLVGMEKPPRSPRETVLTANQFRQLLSHIPDAEFRDYLIFMWNTGCRAMEIRLIEKRHFDGETITLPASQAKGKKHARVIYLNDVALALVNRLAKAYPTGPLFRTKKGDGWKANTVRCRFRTLKTKMDIPELCATTLRHSWATNALKEGMDVTTASVLMGHRDPATLMRNYQHLAKDKQFLTGAINGLPSVDTPQVGQA
jgi:integrase